MGDAYKKNISQFSKGEYPNANNQQDDLAIITDPTKQMVNALGFLAYRADDHGNSFLQASPLIGTPIAANPARSKAAAVGNIERTGDSDWLSFSAGAGAGSVTVAITPPTVALNNHRANVDLRVEVHTVGGLVPLATFNSAGAILNGTFTFNLPAAGTYYISATGVGDTDYSNYASLGEYGIALEYPSPAVAAANEIRLSLFNSTIVKGTSPGLLGTTTTSYRVNATLVAKNQAAAPIAGATITVGSTWASPGYNPLTTSRNVTYTTSSAGTFQVFLSPNSTLPIGVATLTVNSVSAPGYTYNSLASQLAYTFNWP
ncbi:hypothetical protein MNEG_14143 [Monoraphidium neglectum]|uniref:Peptidase C-terminal archaeal/bacterial domain-containing protein n=1 Tax=Monoraphidium neglectum TaxID=145388 RepID=A0A0D2LQ03_9CHLO|nr:hypothetical protein MNEG_14143 [Monoraphidium neglectum]KIY93819.1 hypothetical protein MNEG_14143 [Monoraphidium neglectum]|eukprot:XP_013892839.1 hypothetical protein MNEG_14143 [Monoraphidium neglectum]